MQRFDDPLRDTLPELRALHSFGLAKKGRIVRYPCGEEAPSGPSTNVQPHSAEDAVDGDDLRLVPVRHPLCE